MNVILRSGRPAFSMHSMRCVVGRNFDRNIPGEYEQPALQRPECQRPVACQCALQRRKLGVNLARMRSYETLDSVLYLVFGRILPVRVFHESVPDNAFGLMDPLRALSLIPPYLLLVRIFRVFVWWLLGLPVLRLFRYSAGCHGCGRYTPHPFSFVFETQTLWKIGGSATRLFYVRIYDSSSNLCYLSRRKHAHGPKRALRLSLARVLRTNTAVQSW